MENRNYQPITVLFLLGLFCADVDIFLLQDVKQENDLDKMFTVAEVRDQLHISIKKFHKVLYEDLGIVDMHQILKQKINNGKDNI